MNINATIFGQMLTFGIFIWVNKKFIWPKLLKVLDEREEKIANGLHAAELGEQKLLQAEAIAKQKELETKKHCNLLIAEAKKQAEHILELTIAQATNKSEEIMHNALLQIEQERSKVKLALQQNMANLLVSSTEKIITKYLDQEAHNKILTEISNNIYDN